MKKIIWIIAILLISMPLIVVGCNTDTTPTATTTTTAADQPKYGGVLNYAYTLEPSSLDPHIGNSGGDAYYWKQMYDHIVASDPTLTPDASRSLAETWEFPDPQTMIFNLRKNVKFHDGTEFNAAAVKYNIERIQDPANSSAARAAFLVIQEVEVVDPYTVKFHLSRPWSAGIGLMADRGGAMNSPAAVEQWGKAYTSHPTGTGPFKLQEYVSGASVTMVKNPDYWGKDSKGNALPYTDGLKAVIITDANTLSAALETGQIDLCFIPNKDVAKFQNNANIGVIKQEGTGLSSILYFNMAKPPMDNVYLRKAVASGVNFDAINQAIFFGNYTVANSSSMWPPGTWVYDPTIKGLTYDVDKAKEYLQQGGMPNGFTMDVITWGNDFTQASQMAQEQLAQIGITLNIKVYDVGTATRNFFVNGEAPLFFTSWSRYPEPDWVAGNNLRSDAYYNPGKLSNPTVDALIAQGASEYDLDKRKAIYRQIQTITTEETWMHVGLFPVTYAGYWKDRLAGVENLFGWDAKMDLRWVWLK